jgi:hypothetical protein
MDGVYMEEIPAARGILRSLSDLDTATVLVSS